MKQHVDTRRMGATRREFLARAAAAVAAAGLADLGALLPAPQARAAGFAGTKEAAIGIMAPSHCAAPYVYAGMKDFYGKHGIKANLVLYQNMGEIAGDLLAGKIEAGQLMLPLFLAVHCRAGAFKEKGAPLVTTQATGTKGGAITVRKDSGIKDIDDLAGKRVGSHSPLSAHYLLMQMFIKKNLKLTAPIEVRIIPLEEMIPSLAKGDIDAFIMPEPVNAVAALRGAGQVIFLTSRLWASHPCCMLSATASFAAQNPGTMRAMSLAVAEAGLFAEKGENRSAFIDTIQQHDGYKKIAREILERALEPGRADFFPFPFKSSARVAGDFMKTLKLLPENVTPEQIVSGIDPTHVREALKAAGLEVPGDYRVERVLGEELQFG